VYSNVLKSYEGVYSCAAVTPERAGRSGIADRERSNRDPKDSGRAIGINEIY
jgi:hypothetical protein